MTIKVNDDGLLVLEASGWEQIAAAPQEAESMSKYAITGTESQVLTVKLGPGESMRTEPGTMMYFSNGIGSDASCVGGCDRACSGESCCVITLTNEGGDAKAFAAVTPHFPTAKVVPIDMKSPLVNSKLICQQGAYMASYGDVSVSTSLDFNCMTCCCGGTGFVRQKLTGDGTAFLVGVGTIIQKVLKQDEKIIVDTNCILAFSDTVNMTIRRAGGIVGTFFGGEGIFNTVLEGPGLVVIQSTSMESIRDAIRGDGNHSSTTQQGVA